MARKVENSGGVGRISPKTKVVNAMKDLKPKLNPKRNTIAGTLKRVLPPKRGMGR